MARYPTESRSDRELVEACNDGRPDVAARAFEALYVRHREYVSRVAMRFSRDPEIALDVLQETFTYLLKKFPPTGEGVLLSAKMTTFLYPVAKNLAISAIRKANRSEGSVETSPDELPDPNAEQPATDDLDIALSGLAAQHREILLLRFVDDLSLAEISEILEIPLGTVKSRVHLAIKQLRNEPKIKDLFLK